MINDHCIAHCAQRLKQWHFANDRSLRLACATLTAVAWTVARQFSPLQIRLRVHQSMKKKILFRPWLSHRYCREHSKWPIVSLRCNKHESERDICCNLALCCISSDSPATPAMHCMAFDFRDVRQLLDAVNAEKVSCDEKSLAHSAHRADARGMDGSGHQLAGY